MIMRSKLLLLFLLVGCSDSSKTSPMLVASSNPMWAVDDCYVSKQDVVTPSVFAPWERVTEEKPRGFVNKIIAQWDYVTRDREQVFFHTAYSNNGEPWFTNKGPLWTETPASLADKTKVPCPALSNTLLLAEGWEAP